MNNLDKMKEAVCKYVMETSLEEFYDFFSQIESYISGMEDDENFLPLTNMLKNVFTCSKCKETYGSPCTKDEDDEAPCFERFKQYCEQEA